MALRTSVRLLLTVGSLAAAAAVGPPRLGQVGDPDDDDTPLPLVIWHGLGDDFASDGIQSLAQLAESVHPGTLVYPVRLADSASQDRTSGLFGNLTTDLAQVCADLAAHPILATAPAVDALGLSQGGLFLRAYVQECNAPRIRSLVTLGAPHNGITDFASVCRTGDWLCRGAIAALLGRAAWTDTAQSRIVPAQFFRDPADPTQWASYLARSNFLAGVNNERVGERNWTYAANLASIEHLVLYMFEEDTVLVPKESAWFEEVNGTEHVPLRAREMYEQDWLGLRRLDRKGGLTMRTMPGEHMRLDEGLLRNVFAEFFGPMRKTPGAAAEEEDAQTQVHDEYIRGDGEL